MHSRAAESVCALEEAVPLQELMYQHHRLLGLIEHKVMPRLHHLGPLHMWTRLFYLLQESGCQAWTVLSPEYQSGTPDALPKRQGIQRSPLRIYPAVDLVCPHTIWQLSGRRTGNVMMHFLRRTQPFRTNAEVGHIVFQCGIFSTRAASQLLQD